ncbi:MAG TPA: ferritin-like domain-containing protein, partial [Vicinamibacterales bacterium]|nr:ferritin-like domain-containing protein [Vicinamibacterales bacterium]
MHDQPDVLDWRVQLSTFGGRGDFSMEDSMLYPAMTRRSALRSFGLFGLAATLRTPLATAQPSPAITDEDIFNFALNLESLEAEYYLRGTTGHGMSAADAGPDPGAVMG